MKKTFKVVMLPTEKASDLRLYETNKLIITDEPNNFPSNTKAQHLYIVSDDEIKEGDWAVLDNFIHQHQGYKLHERSKKIVATTDKSLTIKSNYKIDYVDSLSKVDEQLPQLPESFIQAYIKAYNEAKPITEVDLEIINHITTCHECGCVHDYDAMKCDNCNTELLDSKTKRVFNIKTRLDNRVICHTSKMYSRDEVIRLLELSQNATGNISWSDWLDKNP